jgi:hypothetical protein
MSTPISKYSLTATLVLLLAACGSDPEADLKAAEGETAEEAALQGKIECALAGSKDFSRKCTTERVSGAEGQMLVVRHADGGFRRFKILTDGRGLSPADGFDETKISILKNGMIEVSSGDDKYRLPAAIKGEAAK